MVKWTDPNDPIVVGPIPGPKPGEFLSSPLPAPLLPETRLYKSISFDSILMWHWDTVLQMRAT